MTPPRCSTRTASVIDSGALALTADQNGASSTLPRAVVFLTVFFATFLLDFFAVALLVAFLAVFFATFFAGAFFATVATAFFAGAFFAATFLPKPLRIGLPVSSSSLTTSSSVSDDGSRSLGMRPLSLPSLMYGP